MSSNEGLVGSYLGRYKIEELVGRGGMAEVYKATQVNLDRFVAIKIMHRFLSDDRDFLNRFEREARVMAKIRHPNIVHVHDYEVHDDYYYIVMDYLPGGTLKNLLDKLSVEGGVIDLAQASKVTLEIGEALGYAHNIGMVHRDIKPANIMFDEKGIAVLTDFGIARMVGGTTHTTTGSMIGTPAYMSPEQGLGESGDERSDIYSLGVLAYHLFTGRLPFEGDTPLSVVLKHVNENPPTLQSINPDVPDVLEHIVLKAMDKNPDNRWRSVLEMNQEIRLALKQIDLEEQVNKIPTGTQNHPTPVPSLTVPNSEDDSIAARVARTPVTHNFNDASTTILGEAAFIDGSGNAVMPEPSTGSSSLETPVAKQGNQVESFDGFESQNLLPDLPQPPQQKSIRVDVPAPQNRYNTPGRQPQQQTSQPALNQEQLLQMDEAEAPAFDIYKEIEANRPQNQMTTPSIPTVSESDIAAERQYSSNMSDFMQNFDKNSSAEVKVKPQVNPLVKKANRQRRLRGVSSIVKGILTIFFVIAGIIIGIFFVTRFMPAINVQDRIDDLLDNPDVSEVDLSNITADNALVFSPFTRGTVQGSAIILSVPNQSVIPGRWVGSLEYLVAQAETEDDSGLVPVSEGWQPVDGKKVSFDENGEIVWSIDGSFPENAEFRWVIHPEENSSAVIGTSEPFDLPTEADDILEIEISAN